MINKVIAGFTLSVLVPFAAHAGVFTISGTNQTAGSGFSCTDQQGTTYSNYGLWDNVYDRSSNYYSSCAFYYELQGGTFTLNDSDNDRTNWTASVHGTAVNPLGSVAIFDINYDNWFDGTAADYKTGYGSAFNNSIDFFGSASGTITFDNNYVINVDDYYAFNFQYGTGANFNDPNVLGGSQWLNTSDGIWDLAFTIDEPAPVVDVAEPQSLALLFAGLLGLYFSRKKSTKA